MGLLGKLFGFLTKNSSALGSLASTGYQIYKDQALTGAEREANAFSAHQADLSRQFEAQQADIARDWQEHQYLKYNSPEAMRRQYEAAGLNPALMYGSAPGPSASTSSPMPGSASASSVSPQGAGDLVSMFANLSLLRSQKAHLDAQTESEKASARQSSAQALATEIDNLTRPLMNKLGIEKEGVGIDNARLDARLKQIDIEYKPQIFEQELRKGEINIEQLRLGCEKMLLEMRQLEADTLMTYGNIEIQEFTKALLTAQKVAAYASADHMSAQAAETAWRANYQDTYGMTPNQNLYSALTQSLAAGASMISSGVDKFKSWFKGFNPSYKGDMDTD